MCALETSTSGHAHHQPTASAMWGRGVVREARGDGEVGVVVKS